MNDKPDGKGEGKQTQDWVYLLLTTLAYVALAAGPVQSALLCWRIWPDNFGYYWLDAVLYMHVVSGLLMALCTTLAFVFAGYARRWKNRRRAAP
jgi:hypothetical protein